MMVPTVSVVVPAYNAGDWIETTLASVQAQTLPHEKLEVIVIDDGSTDGTAARAEHVLARGEIAFAVYSQENAGPAAARNLGWRRARGEWIQFLDADDVLEPTKIEFQMEAAQTCPGETAAVYSEWGRQYPAADGWQSDGAWVMPRFDADPLCDLLGENNHMATGSQLFRRAWLERTGGYNETYTRIEDVELLLRIVMRGGKLCGVPAYKPLFWYRQRARSLSHSDETAFLNGCIRNAEFVEHYWRDRQGLTAPRRKFLADLYFGAAHALAQNAPADFDRAVQALQRVDPHYVPSAPRLLRWLARGLGYPRAERLAVRLRKVRHKLHAVPRTQNTT